MIVDDQEANTRLLEDLLRRTGYTNLRRTTDPRAVPALYTEFQPDLILLDLLMPGVDGFGVMVTLKPLIPAGTYVPVLVLTADITSEAKQRALASGAKDFLTKPFDFTEVLLRIRNLLETRFLHLHLEHHNRILEQKVRARTQELENAKIEILERLALAAEYRDDLKTGRHTQRVGQAAGLLAGALDLSADQVELIRRTPSAKAARVSASSGSPTVLSAGLSHSLTKYYSLLVVPVGGTAVSGTTTITITWAAQ